jgi:cation diffusion facilitator CzcD-associated flavoprotein CzcO
VHTCVWCDAQLHQGEDRVLVVGGGDSAMEAALYLVKFVQRVLLVHRYSAVCSYSIYSIYSIYTVLRLLVHRYSAVCSCSIHCTNAAGV